MTEKDQEFITRLLEDDEQAWVRLTQQMTLKILRDKNYVAWLEGKGHHVDDVVSELYLILHEDNMRRVRAIKSSLVWWLRSYVEVAVRTVLDPKRRRGGGKELPEILMQAGGVDDDSEEPSVSIDDLTDANDGDHRVSAIGKTASELVAEDEDESDIEYQKRIVRDLFRRFWDENPKTARALSFYLQQRLTYAEVGKIMGEKGNTIQQWIYRSKNWWVKNLTQALKKDVTKGEVDLHTLLMKYLTIKF